MLLHHPEAKIGHCETKIRLGTTRKARQHEIRLTREDKTRQDKTRQDKTRQDKTRQGNTRQDKTKQKKTRHKTRQHKTRPYLVSRTTPRDTNEKPLTLKP